MHKNTSTTTCACGHDVDGHYRGRGVCLKTACPCQLLRPADSLLAASAPGPARTPAPSPL